MPQPRGRFFISHSSKDKTLTTHFGQLLRNVSLHQIEPWFSSDGDHAGGLQPGDMWFEKIRDKMNSSSAIIALITKSSVSSRWVFFESGFGAAIADKKLILVTHDIGSMADIPEPLSRWQAFRIDKSEGLREFCGKLLSIYDIVFDDALFKTHSKTFFRSTVSMDSANVTPKSDSEVSQKLIDHFDRRFFELASQLKVSSQYVNYNVVMYSSFDGKSYQLEIDEGSSVQDTLDQAWEYVREHVEPYMYLQKWVLVHEKTGLNLIIREITYSVPATAIFLPGSKWIAKKLAAPYKPSDSKPESFREKVID
jgi:TIR domain